MLNEDNNYFYYSTDGYNDIIEFDGFEIYNSQTILMSLKTYNFKESIKQECLNNLNIIKNRLIKILDRRNLK